MTFKKNIFFSIFWPQFSKIEVFWLDWSNVMCGIDSESDFRDACVIRIFYATFACTKKISQKMPNFRILFHFLDNFSISRKRSLLDGFYNIFEWYRPNKECVWILGLIWETREFSKKKIIGKKFSNFFDPKNIFWDDVYKSKTLYLGVIVCFKAIGAIRINFGVY